MLANKSSYLFKFIALSSIILSVYWLITMWSINIWQQELLEKTTNKAPLAELQKIALQESDKAVKNADKSLVFAKINLPEVPKNSVSHTNASQTSVSQTKVDKKQVSQKHEPQKKVSQDSTAVIYHQLISDNSINIELAWPNESSARQGLFTFLYQCIGMKFGVLNNQKVTLANTFYQNGNANNIHQPSEWLRLAQGELASQERLWLKQYHLSGTPVRLLPKVVDWQLAKLINNQLNGKSLKSLRAQYKYQHQRLLLTNIQLNNQRLSNNWTLIENKCSI